MLFISSMVWKNLLCAGYASHEVPVLLSFMTGALESGELDVDVFVATCGETAIEVDADFASVEDCRGDACTSVIVDAAAAATK